MYESRRPVKLAGFLAIAGLAVAALEGGDRSRCCSRWWPSCRWCSCSRSAMPRREGVTMTDGMAITTLGVVWVGMAIAHAILLRETPHGDGIIVDILVGTFLGDSGAYFGGRWFGTRPLAPRISPNKTVEGLLDRVRDGGRSSPGPPGSTRTG